MKKILIIRQDRVGDVVLSTSLAESLKNIFPNSYIAFYVKEIMTPILENNPFIDKVIPLNPLIYKGFNHIISESFLIRKHKFDISISPLPEKEIAILNFISCIPKRLTFSRKFYNIATFSNILIKSYQNARHEADFMHDFARYFDKNAKFPKPKIYLKDEDIQFAKNFLISNGFDFSKPIIGINPGSGGSVPNWSIENYYLLVEILSKDYQVVLNFSPSEIELKNKFEKIKNVLILNCELKKLISICSHFSVLISSSTGTMHIASALDVPTITFFCPQNSCSPKVWGALGNDSTNLIATEDYCSDICNHNTKNCTLSDIKVEKVVNIIKERFSK